MYDFNYDYCLSRIRYLNDFLLIDYYYCEIGFLEYSILNYYNDLYYDYCLSRIRYLKFKLGVELYKRAFRFYRNLNSRKNRLFKRLSEMSNDNDLIFVTLTFSDEFINYKESTLHEFVKRYLNSCNCQYVANKDYGELFNRLHYHAILNSDCIELSNWVYGSINVKRVKLSKDDLSRITNYILKFVNHSFKNSTNKYIIYSRKKRC